MNTLQTQKNVFKVKKKSSTEIKKWNEQKSSCKKIKETSECYKEQRRRKTSREQLTSLRRNLFWKKRKLVIIGIIWELSSIFL